MLLIIKEIIKIKEMEGNKYRGTLMLWLTLVHLAIQLLPCTGFIYGVNYGLNGNNLRSPRDVIGLYQQCGISAIRLFEPNYDILQALRGSNLYVALGTRNEDISRLASDPQFANDWVNAYITPYSNSVLFRWITVGNEVVPSNDAPYVARAMENLAKAVSGVHVTTVVSMSALATSYPPSAGAFSESAVNPMRDITSFLSRTGAPLMLNVYPYFAYASDPSHISHDYAVGFNGDITDGGYKYRNIFDAMVDAVHVALEKINAGNVDISISESGWPTSGGDSNIANADNALAYNSNLYHHLFRNEGTPRRPNSVMDMFTFAFFDENLKEAGVEQNFGLFHPDMSSKYKLFTRCG